MFSNRLCYTFSPGGMRRGLIYQSNDVSGRYDILTIKLTNYFTQQFWFGVNDRNKLHAVIDLRSRSLKTSASITNNKFPVAIIPDMKVKINNYTLDTSQLSNLLQMPSYLSASHKTITYKDTTSANTTISFDATVIYYDVTNVPIVSGRYDIPYTPPIDLNVLHNNALNINGNNSIEWETDIAYLTDTMANYDSINDYFTDLTDMNFGKGKYGCTFDFILNQYGNYQFQNIVFGSCTLTGSAPVKFENYLGYYINSLYSPYFDGYDIYGMSTSHISRFALNEPVHNNDFEINNLLPRPFLFRTQYLLIESSNDFSLTYNEANSASIYYPFFGSSLAPIPNRQYQINSLNMVLTP